MYLRPLTWMYGRPLSLTASFQSQHVQGGTGLRLRCLKTSVNLLRRATLPSVVVSPTKDAHGHVHILRTHDQVQPSRPSVVHFVPFPSNVHEHARLEAQCNSCA